jgi:uncharacterized protein DUF4255
MSGAVAIGAVSAVLRNLLHDGLARRLPFSKVAVSAVAPVRPVSVHGEQPQPSVNVFLHRMSVNPGWRTLELPAVTPGGARRTRPPLALDLHYLVTAYGAADFEAEILLGHVMKILHEHPVLDRETIRVMLAPDRPSAVPSGTGSMNLAETGSLGLIGVEAAEHFEAVTVSPEAMDSETMSRLWTALAAPYRPSMPYVVSVVLIESTEAADTSSLPILRHQNASHEPTYMPLTPAISSVQPLDGESAAVLGETVRLTGQHFDGSAGMVIFEHPRLESEITIGVGTITDDSLLSVRLPSGASADQAWPAGIWQVRLSVVPHGETAPRVSNPVSMSLAPSPDAGAAAITRTADGAVQVSVPVHPQVLPGQRVTLSMGSRSALVHPLAGPSNLLGFTLGAVPPGKVWMRLSVDGVECRFLDRSVSPPVFDPRLSVQVPD